MAAGETLNTVIGQGYVLSTPLQITLMTARIATGRKIFPSILKVKNKEFQRMNVSDKALNYIRNSMYSVVNDFDGTAFRSSYHQIIKWLEKLEHLRFVRYQ